MKTKTFNIYFTLLLAIMAISCQNDFSTDAIESFSSEDLNSKVNPNTNIWKYGGQSRITHKIIKDLRHSKEGRKFKKWVSTGAPIWSESKSLLINNEPTILVPIANGNRDGITAIAIFNYLDKIIKPENLKWSKVTRKSIKREESTPLMNRRAWLGYIWSMEKKLYNKKQFYPGFKNNKIKLDKSNLSSRIVCHIEQVGETCWEEVECGDEISDGCTGTVTCYPNYEEVCYDDGYDDNPCYDSCDPDCSNFSYDPCNCDGDCGGTGGGNNPIPGNLENIINLGTKPIAEYSNKCTGIQNIWNSYPNNEVTGYITQDNQLLVIDVLPYSGGTTSGTYTHNSITYYPYPDSDGPPTNSYNGMLHSSGYYLIPVKASVHTHSPCRTDGTNGVSHSVGSDDLTRAQKAPNIKHFIVGCGAIAEYNGTSSNFFNVQTGSLSTLCNNIQ